MRYEEIHDVNEQDLREFVLAGAPGDGDRILDCGCGYGAVTQALFKLVRERRGPQALSIDLIDESAKQLERAQEELRTISESVKAELDGRMHTVPKLSFYQGTFPDDFAEWNSRYDVIYAKQVLHETPDAAQVPMLQRLFQALRPNGRLVIWDIALEDEHRIAAFFRHSIREKDHRAGFETLRENRHFLTRTELLSKLHEAGGVGVTVLRTVRYRFRSARRLNTELKGNLAVLEMWNKYILEEAKALSAVQRRRLHLTVDGDSVDFDVPVVIASAVKADSHARNTLALFSGAVFDSISSFKLPAEIVRSALTRESSSNTLTRAGPALLRVSTVQWRRGPTKPELVSYGLDFVLNWADAWRIPARAYVAYMASLFANAQDPISSLQHSVTGFAARLLAHCGEAGVVHFELDGEMFRYSARSMDEQVIPERTIQLPAGWSSVIAELHDKAEVYGEPIDNLGVRLHGIESDVTVDRYAQALARSTPSALDTLKALAEDPSFRHLRAGDVALAPEVVLRLAAYLRMAESHHAYYLLPPALVFADSHPELGTAEGTGIVAASRAELGSLHMTVKDALAPSVLLELLYLQGAIWHALLPVEAALTSVSHHLGNYPGWRNSEQQD